MGLLIGILPFGFHLEEDIGLDALFTLRGTRPSPSDVLVVTIDGKSAEALSVAKEPRKWPRSLHAQLIEKLLQEGAAVIAFDLIFDEIKNPEEDNLFSEAIRKANNVILCESLKSERILLAGIGSPAENLNIEEVVPPVPSLAQSAVALAPFPLPKVPVKVSQYWTFKKEAGDIPTLPVVVFQMFGMQVYEPFIKIVRKVSPSRASKLPEDKDLIINNRIVENTIRAIRDIFQTDPAIGKKMLNELQNERLTEDPKRIRILTSLIKMYQMASSSYVNFYGPPGTITSIPYYQLLQSAEKMTAFHIKGKAVFIGLSDRSPAEQKDGFHTALSEPSGLDISGVEIAATAFANLLEDRPIQPLSFWGHIATLFFWGALIGTIAYVFPTFIAGIIVLSWMALYFAGVVYLFNTTGTWWTFVVPLLIQSPLAFFSSLIWKTIEMNKERQNIKQALAYYLPDGRMVDQLAKNIEGLQSSKEIVYGICLKTDVQQYTKVSESMNPAELHKLMNQYYEVLSEPIKKYGGIVSDIIGDAMLALWVTRHPDPALRNQACQASIDVIKAVDLFNQSQPEGCKLPTRIGLHSGEMLLGTIKAGGHFKYSAVGDIVNTSERVERLNKILGTKILATEEVIHELDVFVIRELGAFQLKGKMRPISIYELVCRIEESDEQQRMKCAAFSKVLNAFRKGSWDEAEKQIEKCIQVCGEDRASFFFSNLCKMYRKNPPLELWDGVIPLDREGMK
ncbi:MAG: CHASE2 domain-containing protein [Syntrophales bacterium]